MVHLVWPFAVAAVVASAPAWSVNVYKWTDDRGVINYTTEPLPGRFPLPGVGPFSLLEESEANHWGKLAFKWIYWNVLLAGKEIPLDHRMLMAGKWA